MNVKDARLTLPAEFDKRFSKHLQNSRTHKEAYKKTEADFRSIYDENKYSNFESFRRARYVRLKRRLNRN